MRGTTFKITHERTAHSARWSHGGTVEVWRDGKLVATIYGDSEGVKVVSKYLDGTHHLSGEPPTVLVRLAEPE